MKLPGSYLRRCISIKEKEIQCNHPTIKFMIEMLHRSRKSLKGEKDLILFIALLLETYDPDAYLLEEDMRNRAKEILDKMYNKRQQKLNIGGNKDG